MKKQNKIILLISLLFFAIYYGYRTYSVGLPDHKAIYILLVGLLIGLNMFYYVLVLKPGKECWLVYVACPFAVIYILISNTKNVILPMLAALCVLIVVNIVRSLSRTSENENLSGPL